MTHVVAPGGKHLILEIWTEFMDVLRDEREIRSICLGAANSANATVLNDHFHHFGGEYGVSGVVVLAESHISIHTWPETGYCAIDVFMCGNCDPAETIETFLDRLGAHQYSKTMLERPHGITVLRKNTLGN